MLQLLSDIQKAFQPSLNIVIPDIWEVLQQSQYTVVVSDQLTS